MVWHRFTSSQAQESGSVPRIRLTITDGETGKPIAARFTLSVDGKDHEPRWVGPHGLRLASVHVSRPHVAILTYARGTGPVEVALPAGAKRVTVRVTKGFDYVPMAVEATAGPDPPRVDVVLRRWNRLREAGWHAADTHLHYDRVEPEGDRDWFDAMDGDGLAQAHFLVLKAGRFGRVWAEQYAYVKRGEGTDGEKLIVPGEEYRDQLQGHFLLFGLNHVIQPIMAGTEDSPDNYPLSVQVVEPRA